MTQAITDSLTPADKAITEDGQVDISLCARVCMVISTDWGLLRSDHTQSDLVREKAGMCCCCCSERKQIILLATEFHNTQGPECF